MSSSTRGPAKPSAPSKRRHGPHSRRKLPPRKPSSYNRKLAALQAKQTDRGLVLTLGDVLFETGRADLRPGALRNHPLVTFLQVSRERRVLIEGHTDNVGSESYNLDLSHRRADAVRDFLSKMG